MNRIILCLLCTVSVACSSVGVARAPAAPRTASCAGGIVLHDSELEAYRGCRNVSGDLALYGVTTLAPLASLRSVGGTLTVEHTSRLYTLAGLEQLRSVNRLEVNHNASLVNAGALRKLDHVRHVSVTHNPRLSTTYGFLDGMGRAGAEVDLAHNSGLVAEGVTEATPAVAAR
ncbi:MAG TPA: hypothetical protein VFV94_05210 [Polyangiaceae bacterium]|nr:hypothetical protein [Polyangiaceae bacterium]